MPLLKRIHYNAPVILTFFLFSLAALLLGAMSNGWTTQRLFSVYRAPLTDPLSYVRLIGHVFGHANYEHFAGNLLLFTALLFAMGLLTRQEYFAGNFLNTLLLGQALNLFDFLVIDLLWWRHTKRVRFSGTEESPELYADPRKHFYAFLRGVLLFLAVALINGYLLTWI